MKFHRITHRKKIIGLAKPVNSCSFHLPATHRKHCLKLGQGPYSFQENFGKLDHHPVMLQGSSWVTSALMGMGWVNLRILCSSNLKAKDVRRKCKVDITDITGTEEQ